MHKPGIYRHFKVNLYKLITVALDSETLEEMVVYQALYGNCGYWVRPLKMWEEQVEYQGQMVERFKYEKDEF